MSIERSWHSCRIPEALPAPASSGRLCCPTQQFYHPEEAELVSQKRLDEIIEEEGINIVTPRFKLYNAIGDESDGDEQLSDDDEPGKERRQGRRYWSCCGEDVSCTGCLLVCDADQNEDVHAAIIANQQARETQDVSVEEDSPSWDGVRGEGGLTPDWDNSWDGQARRWCSCGYRDGVYSYCAC